MTNFDSDLSDFALSLGKIIGMHGHEEFKKYFSDRGLTAHDYEEFKYYAMKLANAFYVDLPKKE